MKRPLLLPSLLREFLEVLRVSCLDVIRAVLEVLQAFLKFLRQVLKLIERFSRSSERSSAALVILVTCHVSSASCVANSGGSTAGTSILVGGAKSITTPRESMKFVDLPGEMAKAKQIKGGHVFEESHTVDRIPFDHPGLFNDPLDLIFGTDYLYGHPNSVDRDLQGMSSC